MDIWNIFCVMSLTFTLCLSVEAADDPCDTITYLELGKPGIVPCRFLQNWTLLEWFDGSNVDLKKSIPLIYVENSVKKGTGYVDGEYDMHRGGSLIINNVQLTHEKNFTVTEFPKVGAPRFHHVQVRLLGPVIDGCYSQQEDCTLTKHRDGILTCSALKLHLEGKVDISIEQFGGPTGFDLTRLNSDPTSENHRLTTSYLYTVDEVTTESVIHCTLSGMINNQPFNLTATASITWQGSASNCSPTLTLTMTFLSLPLMALFSWFAKEV